MSNTKGIFVKSIYKKNLYWVGVVTVLFISFFTFRIFIAGQTSPYASEIASAFLGALLTVIVTALLLGQQTKSEEAKEKNVAIYTAKLEAYKALMVTIEEIVSNKDSPDDLQIKMQFQAYRTKFIADDVVVKCLEAFAGNYCALFSDDNEFDNNDFGKIKGSLNSLVEAIKADLNDEPYDIKIPTAIDIIEAEIPVANITAQVTEPPSTIDFITRKITRDEFLASCEDSERSYFAEVLDYCEAHADKVVLDWGTKGVSIKNKDRKQFLWMFPKEGANSKSNINLRLQHFGTKRPAIEKIVRDSGIASGLGWRPAQMELSEIKKIINLVCEI